jgi:hypothetical protein
MTQAPQVHQENYGVEKLLLFPRSSADHCCVDISSQKVRDSSCNAWEHQE